MALNIADLFEHAVDVVPERPVIQVGERKVTYAELEASANQLAHFLAERVSAPVTTWASTPRTASSTWWPCSRPSRSVRSPST